MSAENEIQTNLAPVIGWREYVGRERSRFFRTIASGGLALSLTAGGIMHQEKLYSVLPPVLATRISWEGQEAQTRFVDLQQLKEPYGVNVNQEIVNTTVDLVLSNLAGSGIRLNHSQEEYKSSITFLPERSFKEKYFQALKSETKPVANWWFFDSSGAHFYNENFLSAYLLSIGVNNIDKTTLRGLKAQLTIHVMLFKNFNTTEEEFEPVSVYDINQKKSQVYSQMKGPYFIANGETNAQFTRILQEVSIKSLLSRMPALNEDTYVVFPTDKDGMRLLNEFHENEGLDQDMAIRLYVGNTSVTEYLNTLGNGAEDPKQAGVQKIADLINKIPAYQN